MRDTGFYDFKLHVIINKYVNIKFILTSCKNVENQKFKYSFNKTELNEKY